jgi:hypothetical protein
MELRNEKMLTADQRRQMVERIIAHYKMESKTEFARRLGTSLQNINSWLARGTFNAELVAVTFPELSGDWLLTGEEPMLKKDRRLPPDTGIPVHAIPKDMDLRRAVEAIAAEQRLTAKAQAQADKMLSILHMLTAPKNKPSKDAE